MQLAFPAEKKTMHGGSTSKSFVGSTKEAIKTSCGDEAGDIQREKKFLSTSLIFNILFY